MVCITQMGITVMLPMPNIKVFNGHWPDEEVVKSSTQHIEDLGSGPGQGKVKR